MPSNHLIFLLHQQRQFDYGRRNDAFDQGLSIPSTQSGLLFVGQIVWHRATTLSRWRHGFESRWGCDRWEGDTVGGAACA